MQANADNLAIKTEFVAEGLRFEYAELMRVKSVDGLRFEVDVLDSADSTDEDGTIQWRGRPPHWPIRENGG